jgi:hypothetical protein
LPESRVSRSTADRITRIRPRGQFEEDKDSSLRPGGEVYPGRGENTAAPHQGGTESRRVLGSKVQTDLEFSDLLALPLDHLGQLEGATGERQVSVTAR